MYLKVTPWPSKIKIENPSEAEYLYLKVTPWPLEDVGALTPPSPNRAAHANKSKGVIIRGCHKSILFVLKMLLVLLLLLLYYCYYP